MRKRFEPAPDLNRAAIEKVIIPLKSRDELPPILAGLQWIWRHPTLKEELFVLLEEKILDGKQATGRPGMDLWQILVLGVVRLGLDANYDRLEHIANYDTLLRQILGVSEVPWGQDAREFNHQMEDWRRRFKGLERVASKTAFGGGQDNEQRVRKAVGDYLECARGLSAKVGESLLGLCDQAVVLEKWTALSCFHEMLDKHIDLVDRRLLQG